MLPDITLLDFNPTTSSPDTCLTTSSITLMASFSTLLRVLLVDTLSVDGMDSARVFTLSLDRFSASVEGMDSDRFFMLALDCSNVSVEGMDSARFFVLSLTRSTVSVEGMDSERFFMLSLERHP